MIVRNGTGFARAVKVFVLRNWALILTVVLTEQAIVIISRYTKVLETDVFSATAIALHRLLLEGLSGVGCLPTLPQPNQI